MFERGVVVSKNEFLRVENKNQSASTHLFMNQMFGNMAHSTRKACGSNIQLVLLRLQLLPTLASTLNLIFNA